MKKPRPSKEPVKALNVFMCLSCDGKPEFDGTQEIKAHLKSVHKLTELKGQRSMVMHLDCSDSYHSTYEWEISGVKLAQYTCNPRAKNDPMRFGD